MDKDDKKKVIGGIIGIIIIIIVTASFGIFMQSIGMQPFFIVLFDIVMILLGSSPIIAIIGPIILDEIRSKQVRGIERKEKYRICPQCKELIEKETEICPSCGYEL